jgi:hypothetical protein
MTELGNTRPDFEEYFLMWDSVLFYPEPGKRENEIPLYFHAGEHGSIPCHQHRFCKALIKAETRFPPRVCPHCEVDTQMEFNRLPAEERQRLLWQVSL